MKSCKSPDLKAPRFRHSYTKVISSELLNKIKEKSNLAENLTYKDLDLIIKTFNKKIADEIIDNRNGVDLMNGLGKIFVGTCKAPKKKNIDIAKSIKYGVTVIHKNWETDGNLAKIFYANLENKYKFKHNQVWKFSPARNFKRNLAASYKEDWQKYIKVEPNKLIYSEMKNYNRIDRIKKRINSVSHDGYNEFEM